MFTTLPIQQKMLETRTCDKREGIEMGRDGEVGKTYEGV